MKKVSEIYKAIEDGEKIKHTHKSNEKIFSDTKVFDQHWGSVAAAFPEKFMIVKPQIKMYACEVTDHAVPGAKVVLWHKNERAIGNSIPFLRIPAMDYERDITPDEESDKKKGLLV